MGLLFFAGYNSYDRKFHEIKSAKSIFQGLTGNFCQDGGAHHEDMVIVIKYGVAAIQNSDIRFA